MAYRLPLGASIMDRIIAGSVYVRETGCWIWVGAYIINERGNKYGVGKFDGRVELVHRRVFRETRGYAMPKRKQGAHSCDTTLCVCPDHIRGASPRANQREAYRKGRKALSGAALKLSTTIPGAKSDLVIPTENFLSGSMTTP